MSFTHQHPCLADDVRVTAAHRNMSPGIWVASWFSQQEAGKNKCKTNLLFTINCFYYSSEHQASHKSQSNIFLILNFYFLLFISCSASRYFSLLITLFVDRSCTDIEKLFLLIFSKNIIKWRQNTLLIPISHISCQNCFRLVCDSHLCSHWSVRTFSMRTEGIFKSSFDILIKTGIYAND